MRKKFFSVFFLIIILISVISPVAKVNAAFEVTGFDITAKSGALISLDTGEYLFEKNVDSKIYQGSITAIMTATIILESDKYNPEAKIAMTEEALKLVLGTGTAVSHLKANEEITHYDLLHLILMVSCGDTIYLAADYFGGSVENFVSLMNAKAKELSLKNTHFENPIGLHHENHYTTVRDIYKLTEYALKNDTFKEICGTARYHMPATNMSSNRVISTTNFLQDTTTNYYYQYANGVRTGYTDEAGRCVVSTATYNGYTYMCILMGCPISANKRYEFAESAELYRWAFNNFSFRKVADSNEPVCEIPLELSFSTDYVPLYFKEPFVTILPNEADDSTLVIKPKFTNDTAKAPVKKGQVLGTADVIFAEQVLGTVDLVAAEDVKSSPLLVFTSVLKSVLTSTFAIFVYIAVGIAIIIFIILCITMNYKKTKKRKVKYIPYDKGERKHEK